MFRIFGISLLTAVLIASCSLSGPGAPEPLPHFQLLPQPRFACAVTGSTWDCYWQAEAVLTRKIYVERYHTSEPYVDLVLDDSMQILQLANVRVEEVPLHVGKRYRFEGDLVPTFTIGWSSFRVTDESGLVFFATSTRSFSANDSILLAPAGWTFRPEPASYGSPEGFCNTRATPFVLHVEHGGEGIRLVQGETAKLGSYTVACRVAQKMDYAGMDCPDFSAPELSLVIFKNPV